MFQDDGQSVCSNRRAERSEAVAESQTAVQGVDRSVNLTAPEIYDLVCRDFVGGSVENVHSFPRQECQKPQGSTEKPPFTARVNSENSVVPTCGLKTARQVR